MILNIEQLFLFNNQNVWYHFGVTLIFIFKLMIFSLYLHRLVSQRHSSFKFIHPRMYSNSNKKDLNFGVYYLMLNESEKADFYQIFLTLFVLIMMALILTVIFLSNHWKIFRIMKNKYNNSFLFHNFLLLVILCPGIYWFTVFCIIRVIYDQAQMNSFAPLIILVIFCLLCLCALAISGILMRIIIEIPLTFFWDFIQRSYLVSKSKSITLNDILLALKTNQIPCFITYWIA